MYWSCYEREYAEDNDCSLDEAYQDLHCDCDDDEINVAETIDEDGRKVLEFETITDYIKWIRENKNEVGKCKIK